MSESELAGVVEVTRPPAGPPTTRLPIVSSIYLAMQYSCYYQLLLLLIILILILPLLMLLPLLLLLLRAHLYPPPSPPVNLT